jgi:BirA family biotin operon repressor/biotin-[acetyl-CoA-carboxylase] ligase
MQDIGHVFITLDSVDSTNNYAMALAHAGLTQHGFVYFANQQTAGKGQREKSWITEPGQNIILSAVLEPQALFLNRKFLLSAAIALGCYDFMYTYAGSNTKIKWPNDIYWGDRKAGGILIENLLNTVNWKFAIVGIGMNINQTRFPKELTKAVSLKQITGKDWNVPDMAIELCQRLQTRYKQLIHDPGAVFQDYSSLLYKLNEPVKLRFQNILFETIIKSVTMEGKLVTTNALKEEFSIGEVEWVG